MSTDMLIFTRELCPYTTTSLILTVSTIRKPRFISPMGRRVTMMALIPLAQSSLTVPTIRSQITHGQRSTSSTAHTCKLTDCGLPITRSSILPCCTKRTRLLQLPQPAHPVFHPHLQLLNLRALFHQRQPQAAPRQRRAASLAQLTLTLVA